MKRFFRIISILVMLATGAAVLGGVGASSLSQDMRDRVAKLIEPYSPYIAQWLVGMGIRPEIPSPPLRPSFDAFPLMQRLSQGGFSIGQPVFIRIMKKEAALEVFMKRADGWKLFQSYPICAWSGALGPKMREGDGQSPEGFYEVTPAALNPNSNYHLSFNLGFPNAFDRAHRRTGSFLMVHGACASIGCYAMTDRFIEEIYGLVEAALKNGQGSVPVHAFPFRMSGEAIRAEGNARHDAFWHNLKEGWDAFARTGEPPVALVCPGPRYGFSNRKGEGIEGLQTISAAGCQRIGGL
jgi:murein L,D-transpeptidase YafK